MKPASKPQYASVAQPFGCERPRPHCPRCRKAVLSVYGEGLAHADPCPHLSFIFVGEAGEFEYRSPAFEKKLFRRRLNELDLVKLRKLLERIGYGSKLLALEITHGGMACGPFWSTDVCGFDYETTDDDEVSEKEARSGDQVSRTDLVAKTASAG